MKRLVLENYLNKLNEQDRVVMNPPKNKTANAIFLYGVKNALIPTLVDRLKICNQYRMKSFHLYTGEKKKKLELCVLREKVITWRIFANYLKANSHHCKKDIECKKSMIEVIEKSKEVSDSYFDELVYKSRQYNIGPSEVNVK